MPARTCRSHSCACNGRAFPEARRRAPLSSGLRLFWGPPWSMPWCRQSAACRSAPGCRRSSPRNHGARLIVASLLVAVLMAALVAWQSWRMMSDRPRAPDASGGSMDKSVAVLPFADMSEKHDQEYFSDGLAEELIDV